MAGKKFLMIVLALVLSGGRLEAKTEVRIYAIIIKELLSEKGGPYAEMLHGFARSSQKFTLKIHFLPNLRAGSYFLKSKSCIAPGMFHGAFKRLLGKKKMPELVSSLPLGVATEHIVTRPSSAVIRKFDVLKNRPVVMIRGWENPGLGKEGAILVDDESQAVEILLARAPKRVDAALLWLPASQKLIDAWQLSYDRKTVIRKFEDRVECHDTPENREFIAEFNRYQVRLKEPQKLPARKKTIEGYP